MDCTLTILDTAGIQSYIFNTNELRENIGASHLVFLATTDWVQDALDGVVGSANHNYQVKIDEKNPYLSSFKIEEKSDTACAEVMYAGGGNTFILFGGDNHKQNAKDFVFALSLRIIEQAPGLNLYAAHEAFDWKQDNLPETISKAMQKLSFYKNSRPVYQPLLGLSVTAACTSTQLPANGDHPDPDKNGKPFNPSDQPRRPTLANRANRQVMAQWVAAKGATDRLRKLFNFIPKEAWTDDLDLIGSYSRRDESFIAVVHADGNGMGKKMLTLTQIFKEKIKGDPRLYIDSVRELSKQFRQTAQQALEKTVQDFFDTLKADEILVEDKDPFPFRPVIFGGDDVTFVCTGGWGVRLAQRYLYYLESGANISGFKSLLDGKVDAGTLNSLEKDKATKPFWKDVPPYACAGISIVKTHYPISRAYENSEALAKSAKQMVRSYQQDKMASALDWHFTTTGLAGTLGEIRAREYETTKLMRLQGVEGNRRFPLTMRPLMLDEKFTWRNWNNFLSVFTKFDIGWADKRNKMMALRETLRGGPDAVAEFIHLERSSGSLPVIGDFIDKQGTIILTLQNGWMNWTDAYRETAVTRINSLYDENNENDANRELDEIRCAYFDAIELQDQFYELKTAEVSV